MAYKAVEDHRTETALSGKAACFRAKEAKIHTQYVNKPSAGFALDYNVFPVQNKAYGYDSLPAL